MRTTFDQTIIQAIEMAVRNARLAPLFLGGTTSSGGGAGAPPGGFIGYLPQTRVAYDLSELASSGIPSPTSSGSLLDNLNHIRYRIEQLEGGSAPGSVSIYEDDVLVASGVTLVNFEGAVDITNDGGGQVTVLISGVTGSGGGASNFLDLTDTPSTYAGQTGKAVVVNGAETGLEFTTMSGDLSAYVAKSLFDAQTILAATSDDTPAALTVTEATMVGRQTGGNIAAIGQVSSGERTAGTETALRGFSPADVASMAGTHGGGGSASIVEISSETLSGDGSFADVTFSVDTYDEIWVRARVRTADASITDRVGLQVGNTSVDTGNNYAYTVQWQGAATGGSNSAAASIISSPVIPGDGETANYFGDCEWKIFDPNDISQWRNVNIAGGYVGVSGHRTGHGSGVWKNAADKINILNILGVSTATFKAGSKLTVLGIVYG